MVFSNLMEFISKMAPAMLREYAGTRLGDGSRDLAEAPYYWYRWYYSTLYRPV